MQNDILVFCVGIKQEEFGLLTLNALLLLPGLQALREYSRKKKNQKSEDLKKRQGIVEKQFGHEVTGSALQEKKDEHSMARLCIQNTASCDRISLYMWLTALCQWNQALKLT